MPKLSRWQPPQHQVNCDCYSYLSLAQDVELTPSSRALMKLASTAAIGTESPHKYNHVYHVLDAADFPLSLIPSIQRRLSLSPQRSQNRRAKTNNFHCGRTMEMSFIITRSDLLAPRKEQVDSLMPYIVQVLRDALGGTAEKVRLGNVRCVSAKRGWWTSQVKEEIYNRGGGGWMVGKVNVGKSNLFENIFPKGRTEEISFGPIQQLQSLPSVMTAVSQANQQQFLGSREEDRETLKESRLPPVPSETPFPVLPLVSSFPGTTVSPIRLPFGTGKGELVDLPGLNRDGLEAYVTDQHKQDLVMRSRPKPEQISVKYGHSLLLGGLVRITPLTPNLNVLAYPFVPLKAHVASTERAIAIQTNQVPSTATAVAKPGIGNRMASAGRFSLKYDVTKQRAGPLVTKAAASLSTNVLPFLVFSIDVLIEGCGWVELVAQVRKKDFEHPTAAGAFFDDNSYPQVEIVSPGGRHIGVRRPMGAWLLCGRKPGSLKARGRPRRSMKGVKKRSKASER
ncbi:MAG: hypothetical protein Q9217_002715 [Psora testacea]